MVSAFANIKDELPYIDPISELPNTHFVMGHEGIDITFSPIAAQITSASIKTGKHPGMDLFSFNR